MPPLLPDTTLLTPLLFGGLTAAFLHAVLPTHWLPFVLVGRAQKWTLATTLGAVLVAGLAHVGTTALAGSLIALAGLALERWISGLLPWLSAGLLFLLGLFYLHRAGLLRMATLPGPVLEHGPPTPGTARLVPQTLAPHTLANEPDPSALSQTAAFWGLVVIMAASPGEVLLPLYLSASTQGPAVLGLLTLVFAVGTILGMALFTVLARMGAAKLRLDRLARYEGAILGLTLIGLGVLTLWHHTAA